MTTARTVAVVTGSRADFGLLRPVMRAVRDHRDLVLQVVAGGAHLLPPAQTIDEVTAAFDVAATIAMQTPGETGRVADAAALGRGVSGFAEHFAQLAPDIVLVLGDRIEAFAAAAAASVGGRRLAHLHGGDRAEGVADESLRHAITKLAHVHLPATAASAERIMAMGEDPARTHVVGSPAIDALETVPPLADEAYEALGRPEIVFLLHPTGEDSQTEQARASGLLHACLAAGRVLALDPNFDPGRDGIVAALDAAGEAAGTAAGDVSGGLTRRPHLDRDEFVGLLRRVHMIVGNSSAGLIECAAVPLRCVNVGPRQRGREMPEHVIDCPEWDAQAIRGSIDRAVQTPLPPLGHPYGDGRAGPRTADVLASVDADNHPLHKRNTY